MICEKRCETEHGRVHARDASCHTCVRFSLFAFLGVGDARYVESVLRLLDKKTKDSHYTSVVVDGRVATLSISRHTGGTRTSVHTDTQDSEVSPSYELHMSRTYAYQRSRG